MKMDSARAGLIDFACYIDRQAQQWYRASHLRTIASVLERVERGELKRVIISVPPRHWKSSLASFKFPAWYLGRHNDHSIIIASYALSLAEKYSKSVRETIQGNGRYKSLFPDVRIRRDSNSAHDWLLETGYQTTLRAVGTGGGIAGYGFKLALLDDVSDPNKQSSITETESDWEWYKNVIRTRAEPDAAIVVVNNRVGVNDLVGYLLDPERNDSADPPEDWTYIEIPALGADGNYLWVDRFGAEYYQKLQNDVTLWRVQYQQKPTLEAGNLIKRDWFEYVERLPEGATWRVRAWDCAFTEKQTEKQDPDFSATCKSVVHDRVMYLGAPRLFRKSIEDLCSDIVATKREELGVRFGMGRVAVRSSIIKAMTAAGQTIGEYEEDTDKITRAGGWIPLAAQGRVKLVGTVEEWKGFMTQLVAFPAGHDDAVDCISGCAAMQGFFYNAEKVKDEAAVTQREAIAKAKRASDPNAGRYMGEFAPRVEGG